MQRPQQRATLADVARLAGVSAKTVSRVYDGSTNVSPDTRRRIEEAAARLSFRPNLLARDLRHGGVSSAVGFVLGDLTNPFYFQVAAGMERELAQHGLTMVLTATEDDPAEEERVAGTLLAQRVRALVLVPIAQDQSYLESERRLGTPVVTIDRPAHNLLADSVVLDNREGTAEAVRALTRLGHRRIAFVCSPADLYTHAERLAGYREALREVGVTDSSSWERLDDAGGRSTEAAVLDVLDQPDPPTAVVTGNNRASAALVRALGPARDDLAYVGFDDFDLADAFGFSVVAYDTREIGRAAARRVLERLADPQGAPVHVRIPTHLVARGSGERPPARSS
ncbi:LacI family DNA-binding transcriptional regulator [Cellulosimicrobium cellulans]|uniref:LacI family DNA-binding transcriptional regulator n=1 Tax=Cellulosimicrobium cellulans TaxID=1710 RepID=UPI0038154C2D